jgi:hypothetical protein
MPTGSSERSAITTRTPAPSKLVASIPPHTRTTSLRPKACRSTSPVTRAPSWSQPQATRRPRRTLPNIPQPSQSTRPCTQSPHPTTRKTSLGGKITHQFVGAITSLLSKLHPPQCTKHLRRFTMDTSPRRPTQRTSRTRLLSQSTSQSQCIPNTRRRSLMVMRRTHPPMNAVTAIPDPCLRHTTTLLRTLPLTRPRTIHQWSTAHLLTRLRTLLRRHTHRFTSHLYLRLTPLLITPLPTRSTPPRSLRPL